MDLTYLTADSNKIYEKCGRVRSWYMYKQLKSLERDQQDAARRLKSKSSVDRFLRRELSDRRVKRRLSDKFSSCHDELQRSSRKSELVKSTSCSLDNFFVDICQQETNSFYSNCIDSKGSITSNDVTDSDNRDYDITNYKMTKNLKLQLENMNDDIDDFDLYDGEISEQESFGSCNLPMIEEANKNQLISKYSLNTDAIMCTWSKLVTYAHQIMKLHHGANCYVDYSSQILTAVLVVDVLRVVVGRMCDILQPLVCPISFNSDDGFSSLRKKKHKHGIRDYRFVSVNIVESEYRINHYDYGNRQNVQKWKFRDADKSLYKCICLRRVIHHLLNL